MGGIDRVVELARKAFDDGDFRWAATLLDHAIFTDENHAAARELYADTLEQLAYGAENAVWRNFFLVRRNGTARRATSARRPRPRRRRCMGQLTPEQMFDTFAISINGPRAWDLDVAVDITFLDVGDQLPADAAQRRAGLSQGARRRIHRQRPPSSWQTSCGC